MSEQERTEKRHPSPVPGFTVDEMIRGLKVVARLAVDMDWSKLANRFADDHKAESLEWMRETARENGERYETK